MTLTPDQFNLLATKDDMNDLEKKIDEKMTTKMNKILTAVDGITKKYKDHKDEHVANFGAHDRMQTDINEVRGHVGLEVKNSVITPKIA